jgi:hypothetical protein
LFRYKKTSFSTFCVEDEKRHTISHETIYFSVAIFVCIIVGASIVRWQQMPKDAKEQWKIYCWKS